MDRWMDGWMEKNRYEEQHDGWMDEQQDTVEVKDGLERMIKRKKE